MPVSEYIKPISGKHSIKEAAITIFLANPINDPSTYKRLLDGELEGLFNQFELLEEATVQVEAGTLKKFDRIPNVGFRISSLKNDQTLNVLQGKNEQGRSYFSFHTLDYDRWAPFLKSFINIISTIGGIHGEILAKAYSLHYVDQFQWISKSSIDFKIIFDENSKLLPGEFFSSTNNGYTWLREKKAGDHNYFDRLEVNVDYLLEKPLITISHNAIKRLDQTLNISELIKKEEFKQLLEHAHSYNKETLKSLLKSDVQTLIKL